MAIEYLDKLSEEQIKDQAMQVVNYSPNVLGDGKFPIAAMFSNFVNILKESVKGNDKFAKSLDNSLEYLINEDIDVKLNELKEGEKSSFLVIPILAEEHTFGSVVHKNKDGDFECVIVNKGERPIEDGNRVAPNMKYTIPKEKIKDCFKASQGDKQIEFSIEEVYSKFRENSKTKPIWLEEMSQTEQKKGNCYYKEIEAALKYAYHSTRDDLDNKEEIYYEWPIETQELHTKFLANLKEEVKDIYPNIVPFIDSVSDRYITNKEFRTFELNEIEDSTETKDVLYEKQKEKFIELYCNNDATKLPEGLKKLDVQTLTKNSKFFHEMINDYNEDRPKEEKIPIKIHIAIESMRLAPNMDGFDALKLKDELDGFIKKYEEFFPSIVEEMKLEIADIITQEASYEEDEKNYEQLKKLSKAAIEINPNDAYANYYYGIASFEQGDFEKAQEHFEKTILLNPNDDTYKNLYIESLEKSKNDKYYELAEKIYKAGLDKENNNNKNDAYMNYYLGVVNSNSKMYKTAQEYLEKAAQLEPENEEYKKVLNNNKELLYKKMWLQAKDRIIQMIKLEKMKANDEVKFEKKDISVEELNSIVKEMAPEPIKNEIGIENIDVNGELLKSIAKEMGNRLTDMIKNIKEEKTTKMEMINMEKNDLKEAINNKVQEITSNISDKNIEFGKLNTELKKLTNEVIYTLVTHENIRGLEEALSDVYDRYKDSTNERDLEVLEKIENIEAVAAADDIKISVEKTEDILKDLADLFDEIKEDKQNMLDKEDLAELESIPDSAVSDLSDREEIEQDNIEHNGVYEYANTTVEEIVNKFKNEEIDYNQGLKYLQDLVTVPYSSVTDKNMSELKELLDFVAGEYSNDKKVADKLELIMEHIEDERGEKDFINDVVEDKLEKLTDGEFTKDDLIELSDMIDYDFVDKDNLESLLTKVGDLADKFKDSMSEMETLIDHVDIEGVDGIDSAIQEFREKIEMVKEPEKAIEKMVQLDKLGDKEVRVLEVANLTKVTDKTVLNKLEEKLSEIVNEYPDNSPAKDEVLELVDTVKLNIEIIDKAKFNEVSKDLANMGVNIDINELKSLSTIDYNNIEKNDIKELLVKLEDIADNEKYKDLDIEGIVAPIERAKGKDVDISDGIEVVREIRETMEITKEPSKTIEKMLNRDKFGVREVRELRAADFSKIDDSNLLNKVSQKLAKTNSNGPEMTEEINNITRKIEKQITINKDNITKDVSNLMSEDMEKRNQAMKKIESIFENKGVNASSAKNRDRNIQKALEEVVKEYGVSVVRSNLNEMKNEKGLQILAKIEKKNTLENADSAAEMFNQAEKEHQERDNNIKQEQTMKNDAIKRRNDMIKNIGAGIVGAVAGAATAIIWKKAPEIGQAVTTLAVAAGTLYTIKRHKDQIRENNQEKAEEFKKVMANQKEKTKEKGLGKTNQFMANIKGTINKIVGINNELDKQKQEMENLQARVTVKEPTKGRGKEALVKQNVKKREQEMNKGRQF